MTDNHEHGPEFDGFAIDYLKKNFKALAQEIEGEPDIVVENDTEQEESQPPHFRGYQPNIYDFLARANTDKECLEIIEYCLRKGEITEEEAIELRHRLDSEGPNTFGTRRPGYYERTQRMSRK